MKKFKLIASVLLITTLSNSLAYGHSGRTDSKGGHYNRTTGVYHYHNGGTSNTTKTVNPVYSKPYVAEPVNKIMVTKYKKPIIINGKKINDVDDQKSMYPMFSYKDVVYIPLTEEILTSLGINGTFENNVLELTTVSSYDTSINHKKETLSSEDSVYLSKPSYKIKINGQVIDNDKEEYQFLNYNGTTYIPLTWNNVVTRLKLSYPSNAENLTVNNFYVSPEQKALNDLLIKYIIDEDIKNVKMILEKGANPNVFMEVEEATIPVIAVTSNVKIAEILLNNNASLFNKVTFQLTNDDKETFLPIIYKLYLKEFDMVELYLQYGYNRDTIIFNDESLINYLTNLRNFSDSKDDKAFYNKVIKILNEKAEK